jgi:hypothetical protein
MTSRRDNRALVEKVGRIHLHAGEGQGLDALLTKLVRLKADEYIAHGLTYFARSSLTMSTTTLDLDREVRKARHIRQELLVRTRAFRMVRHQ